MVALRLALALLLCAASAAKALEPPPPYFDDAGRDGKGVVWAFSRAEYNQLFAFDGKQWSSMPAAFAAEKRAMPARLGRMADGSVVCVWRLGENEMAVTRHLGSESKLLAECAGKIPGSGLEVAPFGDSKNRIWITGRSQEIHRVDRDGHTMEYKIQPEQFINPRGLKHGINEIHAAEDGLGRVWAWSNTCAGGSNYASLRGFLIFDGEKVEHREQIDGIKGKTFSVLVRKDATHMWLSVANEGLFEIDIDTMHAKPVAEPMPHAFACVQQIFHNGGDWFFIAEQGSKGVLWRLRGSQWKQILDSVDSRRTSGRAWLGMGDKLILCSSQSPWLIREGIPPVQLDWQNGFALEGVHSIFLMGDGKLFALGRDGALFYGKIPLASKSESRTRVTELKMRNGWTLDSAQNVWWIADDKTNTLCQWNGERIVKHALPDGAESNSIEGVAADSQGRIWLLPGSNERVAAFFDSRSGKWQAFPKIEDAYQSVLNDPPKFPDNGPWFYIPQFSADHRRITFRSGRWEVAYFDGAQWKRWKRKDLGPIHADNDFTLGQPFFDAKGALCVTTRYHGTLQFDEKGNWTKTEPDTRFSDPFTGNWHQPARPEVPEGSPTRSPDSIEMDNLGAIWLNAHGHLYKCVGKDCVEIFSKDEPNPFTTRRLIRKAVVGRGGNVFLETASQVVNWFMIAPKSPPPKTSITMRQTAPDSFNATLNANSRSKVQFRWRLDGEPWQMTKEKTLAFDSLPNGTHTLTASAIDSELQSDTAPAVAEFEIKVDPAAQVAALIKRLADPDYARRESAVAALARQPAIALPALKAAQEIAGENQQWWIEAAIQEIDRKLNAKP